MINEQNYAAHATPLKIPFHCPWCVCVCTCVCVCVCVRVCVHVHVSTQKMSSQYKLVIVNTCTAGLVQTMGQVGHWPYHFSDLPYTLYTLQCIVAVLDETEEVTRLIVTAVHCRKVKRSSSMHFGNCPHLSNTPFLCETHEY